MPTALRNPGLWLLATLCIAVLALTACLCALILSTRQVIQDVPP